MGRQVGNGSHNPEIQPRQDDNKIKMQMPYLRLDIKVGGDQQDHDGKALAEAEFPLNFDGWILPRPEDIQRGDTQRKDHYPASLIIQQDGQSHKVEGKKYDSCGSFRPIKKPDRVIFIGYDRAQEPSCTKM